MKSHAALAFLVLLCFVALPVARAQSPIYVKADATGANNGSSWVDAFSSLQDALTIAATGDEIWVAQGTYTPDKGGGQLAGDRTASFQLKSGVALFGGFVGHEVQRQERQRAVYPTLLSGDIGVGGEASDNAYHVVTATDADATAILDGFIITAGNANGDALDGFGGGVFNEGGSPTFINLRFLGNAALNGAALYNRNGAPLIVNTVFSGNTAAVSGGAVYNEQSNPTFTNVTLSGNTAPTGAGIYNQDSSPLIANSILWGNTVGDPSATLACEREGYPCSFAEVDPAVFDQSDQLADEIFLRLDNGEPIADVLTWVEGQAGVVEAIASQVAIRFRMAGGRPIWVFSRDAILIPDGTPDPVAVPTFASKDVVGDDPKVKRALVLSVYQYDFGGWDEGSAVAGLLGGARSYEGRVEYYANTEREAQVFPDHFENWGDYQVIHVSSHGTQVCNGDDCETVVLAGATSRDIILTTTEDGVDLVRIEYGEYDYGASTDFFLQNYPNGLADTIVFINACETAKGEDLADALTMNGGVYLGWTESVWSDTANRASLAFYENLINKGIPSSSGYNTLRETGGDLTLDRVNSSGTFASLALATGGDALRIREVVWIQHPLTKEDLPSETTVPYPVVGQPEDGDADWIPYLIKVDGVEGEPQGFTVHVTVNGFAGDPKPLSDGTMLDSKGNVWQVKGEVSVPFDAQQGQEVEIKVEVDLPEGGQSKWEETVTLGNPDLYFASEIKTRNIVGDDIVLTSRVEAEFPLSFSSNLGTLVGRDDLIYKEFIAEHPVPECSLPTTTTDGTLTIREVVYPPGQNEVPVPDEMLLFVPPLIKERLTIICPQGTIAFDFIHWFAGFYSFHGGELGHENEVDEDRGGLVIQNWTAGADNVIAKKVYDRTGTEGEVAFSEKTTIELRKPDQGGVAFRTLHALPVRDTP